MSLNQFDLLKSRRFLPLFITQFLTAFNDNVYKNALAILITYRIANADTLNPQILVTLAAGIFILPFFLFSATAGQMADKFEKSRLIAIIKFFEILLMLVAASGFYYHSLSLLMTALFLLGIQAAFFGPVKYSILPDQLHTNELIAGNGLIEAGTFVAILAGTVLGGLLILLPDGEGFIITALFTVAISGFLVSLLIPETHSSNPDLRLRYNFISETWRVIQYSRLRQDIFLSILGISWFWMIGAIFLAEFPVFAKDTLHADEHVVTLFISLFSIGIAIGSLLCNRLLKGKIEASFVPVGAIGMTVFMIDLFFSSRQASLAPVISLVTPLDFLQTFQGIRITLDLVLISIFSGLYTVPLYAILQQRSEAAHRARVIASNNVLNALFMVLGAIGTLLMLKMDFSVIDVFLTIAILNSLVAAWICKLLPDLLLKSLLHGILKALYKVEVIGLQHYEQSSPRTVIIANHTSFLDAALLAAFLPDKLTFAVDTQMARKKWIRFFLRLVDTFEMDPTNPMAIKSLIDYVKHDRRCVIFPEGRLTMTGALMKIHEGPGLVADKADAQLLPIRIEGAQFTPFTRLRGKVPIRWAPKITLTLFKPLTLDIPDDITGRERRHRIGLKLYDIMTTLMFESSNYHQTLFQSLLQARALHGRGLRILEDMNRQPMTYQQLVTRSFILGGVIARRTVAGKRIGVLLPNVSSTVVTFFAMQAYGRVPAMLNYSAGIRNTVIACQTATISVVYTASSFVALAGLQPMIDALKEAGIQIIYLETLGAHLKKTDLVRGFVLAQFPQLAYRIINRISAANRHQEDEAAVVLFTSGSEGTPKGVVLSHKNIQANRYQLSACVDFTATDRILNILPVFHSFGLMAGMLMPILSGIPVFFYPSPLHYRIIPQLSYDINATILFGTDTFLSNYAKYAHPYDFYSIRYVFSGAEKLHKETIETWSTRFGVRIFDGYGATETAPVISTNTPLQNRSGTVGRILPGIQYQLRPIEGIAEGGELLVKGPNVMKGYLRSDHPGLLQPLATEWYDTGDIVTVDEEGFVTIRGRLKRFAKLGGEMVSLTMVEQQIALLWPGEQHAVITLPDPKKGEQLVLVTTHADATREALVSFAKATQMSEIAIPKKIVILKELPLLGSGKTDYVSIRTKVEQASGSDVSPRI